MQNNEEISLTDDLKLHLDLEELKPKYDSICPELFQAMEHVVDDGVKGQLECLLSDVFETFLKPELGQQPSLGEEAQGPPHILREMGGRESGDACHMSLFLETIRDVIKDPSDATKLAMIQLLQKGGVNVKAISKLDQAKSIQKRIEELDNYFSTALSSIDKISTDDSVAKDQTRGNQALPNVWNKKTTYGLSIPRSFRINCSGDVNCSSLHCKNGNRNSVQNTPTNVLSRRSVYSDSDEWLHFFTPINSCDKGGDCKYIDQLVFESHSSAQSGIHFGMDMTAKSGADEYNMDEQHIPRKTDQSVFTEERRKLLADNGGELQLNLPPIGVTDSKFLVTNGHHQFGKDGGRRNTHHNCAGCIVEDLETIQLDYSYDSHCCESENGGDNTGSEKCDQEVEMALGGASAENHCPEASHSSVYLQARDYVTNGDMISKVHGLVDDVHDTGNSLKEREWRTEDLKKRNALLEEQILEVEGTLESFDTYLKAMETKPFPQIPESMKIEMCDFQEAFLSCITYCVKMLNLQMKTLQESLKRKSDKVEFMLARYEQAKMETPCAMVYVGGVLNCVGHRMLSPPRSRKSSKTVDPRAIKSVKAIVKGIEVLHASCENVWNETLDLVFSEMDALFNSLPSPPPQKWTPDQPVSGSSVSLSHSWTIDDDFDKMISLPGDKSNYGPVIIFSLRMLERVCSEIGHLMVVTRIKDLQMISIDHSIGLVYMSIKQMSSPTILANSKLNARPKKKRKKKANQNQLDRNQTFLISEDHDKTENKKERESSPPVLVPNEEGPKEQHKESTSPERLLFEYRMQDDIEETGSPGSVKVTDKELQAGKPCENSTDHVLPTHDMHLPLIGASIDSSSSSYSSEAATAFSPWGNQKEKLDVGLIENITATKTATAPGAKTKGQNKDENISNVPRNLHKVPAGPKQSLTPHAQLQAAVPVSKRVPQRRWQ